MEDRPPLHAVGFWSAGGRSNDPHPADLSKHWYASQVTDWIAAYLRSGQTYRQYLGYSFCRFACGTDDRLMGDRSLTDGIWVWPEGLVHYVVEHAIELPQEFLATMEENLWVVPQQPEVDMDRRVDLGRWRAWAGSRATREKTPTIRTLRLVGSRRTQPDRRYFCEHYSTTWCEPLVRVFW